MKQEMREVFIKRGAKEILNDLLGGFENTLLDYSEDSEEYKNAKRFLENEDEIVETVYKELVNNPKVATPMGIVVITKDIRFVGKERTYEIIREIYKKEK